jgi:hypothetical protein
MLKPEYKHHPAVLVDDSSKKTPLWNKGLAWISNSLAPTTTSYQGFTTSNKHEGGGLMSALKRYFSSSPLSTPHCQLAAAAEQENEDIASPSATSTPKLSLDCGSEPYDDDDEEQDYFNTITPTHDDTDPFIYIPQQEPIISKKRRSSEDTRPVQWQPADKKRRKSNEEIVLLRTTVAKGSCGNAQVEEPSFLTQQHRIDYVLRPERFYGMAKNEYVSGLTAHFSYWTHQDLMWHIVRRLENMTF